MLDPSTLYTVVDMSNWTGPLAAIDVQAIRAAGIPAAIVRMSLEDTTKRALTVQQLGALAQGSVARMGYPWCYWSLDPVGYASQHCAFALTQGIRVLWWDAEDDPVPGVDTVQWLGKAVAVTQSCGFIAGVTTNPGWWQNHGLDLSPLGDVPWWIADYDGKPLLAAPLPYAGATLAGHQYTNGFPGLTKVYDGSVFRFPKTICDILNAQGGQDVDETQVRAIVQDELNNVAKSLAQGDDFGRFIGAMLARLGAAGRALDLNVPLPPDSPKSP